MFDAVLIARHHRAANLAVKDRLALVVKLTRHGIEPFDQDPADAAFLAQPKRRADDEDVGGQHLLPNRGPVVSVPAVVGHVRIDAGRHLVVE